MIQVTLNDETKALSPSMNLHEALTLWGYDIGTFAAAVNQTFIPMQAYTNTMLQEGDNIQLVFPMQGG